MLLCISGQGLTTVQAPKSLVTQKSPSVTAIVLHFLFFFPRLLYHAIKAPLISFAHPFDTPISNIAKTSEDNPQDSDDEYASIEKASTTPDDKGMEQTNTINTPPASCVKASLNASSNEFDIDNEAWKEAWRFANHITYSLRLQIARGYLEGKMYWEQVDESIVELRELEGRAWEWKVADSEGGSSGGEGSDVGWVETPGVNE